jgi:pyroglutamyl-peptidase
MRKLLLTGFEPFLHFTINPTMEIVKQLDGKTMGDYEIVGRILSVDFKQSGTQVLQHFEEVRPDVVVSLGLAGGRAKITPERIGVNCSDGHKDNTGYLPVDEPIAEDGADGLFTKLPIRTMIDRLHENGLPAEISNTAGTYLCNNVMYTMLHHIKTNKLDVRSGFIHIPASHAMALEDSSLYSMPSWSQDDLLKAVEICIETL